MEIVKRNLNTLDIYKIFLLNIFQKSWCKKAGDELKIEETNDVHKELYMLLNVIMWFKCKAHMKHNDNGTEFLNLSSHSLQKI